MNASCALRALLSLACLLPATALAERPFVNTRGMQQHAARLQPKYLPLRHLLSSAEEMPYVHQPDEEDLSALEEVERLPRPLKVSMGTLARGRGTTAGMLAGYRDEDTFAVGGLRRDVSESYADGDGNRVPFGYRRLTGQLHARQKLNASWEATLDFGADEWDELRVPNYSMDGRVFDRRATRLSIGGKELGPGIAALRAHVEWLDLDLQADNYTQRSTPPLPLAVAMHNTRITFRGEADIVVRGLDRLTVGIDSSTEHYDSRLMNMAVDTLSAYRHPDVRTEWRGLYGDMRLSFGEHQRLRAGLRYDHVLATAEHIDRRPVDTSPLAPLLNRTPRELYAAYYGSGTDDVKTDGNLSGRLRLERDLGREAGVHLEASRMLRAGSPSERWFAVGGVPAMVQVGNPDLAPEQHRRIDLGGWWQSRDGGAAMAGSDGKALLPRPLWRLEASLWVDDVRDFITGDRARGQTGVLKSDGGIIYRNVDATLSGAQASLTVNPTAAWSGSLRYRHTRGDNDTDGRALYQIAPDEWDLAIAYHHGSRWHVGTLARFVARQDRVDDDRLTGLGQDTGGVTPGFTTLDLDAGMRLSAKWAVVFGVSNLLDRTYHEHVNGLPQSATTQPINAPGRTAWLRLIASL